MSERGTISFFGVLRIHTTGEHRRKFILDVGNMDRGRISIYLNENDRLAFELIDAEGEAHFLEGPAELPRDSFAGTPAAGRALHLNGKRIATAETTNVMVNTTQVASRCQRLIFMM